MARGNIGSFTGAATAGANMLEIFEQTEKGKNHKFNFSAGFNIQKIAISGETGTKFSVNGCDIVLPSTGIFETDEGMIELESLIFESAADVCIVYLY